MKPIPRASTQKNVNNEVFKFINNKINDNAGNLAFLDIPCGDGLFAEYLKSEFPNMDVSGVDLFTDVKNKKFNFYKLGAHDFFKKNENKKFDIITCISGVMCFDGVADFIATLNNALNPKAVLIITNDNIMSVRDRLHFLFFGHFKRFKLLYGATEGNWNLILPQALVMLLKKNEFKNIKIKYTAVYIEDLFLIPVAACVYVLFFIYLMLFKNEMTLKYRCQLFPFKMLISRHYVISAEK